MLDVPPPPPTQGSPVIAEAERPPTPAFQQRSDGTLVIDLTQIMPTPLSVDCAEPEPDPFDPEIVVC